MASFAELGDVTFTIDFAGEAGIPYAVYALNQFGEIVAEIFVPHAKQIRFFNSRKPFVLFGGARGGGKTAALVWKAVFTCMSIPGCKVLILRRTFPELEKTDISYFLDYVPNDFYFKYNHSKHVATFHNGSSIHFGSCDTEERVRQYLSGEYVLIEVDEQSEFTYSMWNFLKGSNRCKTKIDSYGRPVTPQMVGATNPGGIGGEFCRALFVQKKQVPGEDPDLYNPADYDFIQSLVSDNPTYREDANYLKMLDTLPPGLRAAWRDGLWDTFEGQFFETFDISVTGIPADLAYRLMMSQPWQPRWISIDWGYSHHSVALWHTMIDLTSDDGKTKITVPLTYRELAVHHTGEKVFAQMIVDRTDEEIDVVYLDSACFGDGPNNRADLIGDVFILNKIPRPSMSDKERVDGWRFMHGLVSERHKLIRRGEGQREYAGWLISDKCEGLLTAIPQLIRNPKRLEDVKKTETLADDFADCARYGLKTHLAPSKRPFEVVRAETLANCDNNNHRYMTDLRMKEKRRKQRQRLMNRGRTGRMR